MTVKNGSGNTTKIQVVTAGQTSNENIMAELTVLEEKYDENSRQTGDTQMVEVTLKVPQASFLQSASQVLSPHLQSSFSPREFMSFAGGYDTVKRAFTKLFDENGDGFVERDEFMKAISTVKENSSSNFTDEEIMFLFDEFDIDKEGLLSRGELIRGFRPYFDQVNTIDDIGSMLSMVLQCARKNRQRKDDLVEILKQSNYCWECFVAALPLAEMSLDIAVCYALFMHGHYALGAISLIFQAMSGRMGFFMDFGLKRHPLIKLNTAVDILVIYIPFATFLAHKAAKVPIHLADQIIGELVTLTIFYVFYFQAIVSRWHAATLVLTCTDPTSGECRFKVPEYYTERPLSEEEPKRKNKQTPIPDLIGDDAVVRYMTDFDDTADVCRAGFVIEVVQGIAHPAPQIIIQLIAGLSTGLMDDPAWGPVFVVSLLVSGINLVKAFFILSSNYSTVTSALRNLVEETEAPGPPGEQGGDMVEG